MKILVCYERSFVGGYVAGDAVVTVPELSSGHISPLRTALTKHIEEMNPEKTFVGSVTFRSITKLEG